jgi:2',3'-cyclic-nucleotide 2'-phosphodiesterase (5'-nucleotidase family)
VKLSGNEEIGSFYTDALRNTFHFDMAFQNSGGIRINEIHEGDITMETIYRMDPFGNYLMGIHLDAEEIRSLIKYSFRNGRIDLRVSGIQYTIVKENEAIKEIIITDDSGNLIDENKSYFVGMNDYILSTYQFSHNDNGNSMGITTAEVIIEYLKKTGEINYSGVKRTNMQDLNKVN